jgi:hypothetical protein
MHCLEYGLQLAGRAGDDAEHLRRRGLPRQRLGKFAGPLVELVLELGCGGTATTRSGWRIVAFELCRLAVSLFLRRPALLCGFIPPSCGGFGAQILFKIQLSRHGGW